MSKLVFLLLLSLSLQAQVTSMDNYLAYTAELLEKKQLDDEHLLRMIAGAEQSQVVNPITEQEGRINLQREVARIVFNQIIPNCFDHARITPWATERLSEQARERKEKRQKSEETKIPFPKAASIVAGPYHTCAIRKSDRKVFCWGNNKNGETEVPDDLGPVVQLSLGKTHSCVLLPDGFSRCWGAKGFDEKTKIPIEIGPLIEIYAGDRITCYRKLNGELGCVGRDEIEQFGSSVSSSGGEACFLANGSWIHCIYPNGNSCRQTWQSSEGVTSFHVGQDNYGLCFMFSNSTAQCAGNLEWDIISFKNSLGNKGRIFEDVRSVSISDKYVCVLYYTGDLECFVPLNYKKINRSDFPPLSEVAAGNEHVCGIDSAYGQVVCKGKNEYGQLNIPTDLKVTVN